MQYLDQDTLIKNIPYIPLKSDDLISADSYNEEEIMIKFNNIDDYGRMLLLRCAIHISVIGSGNKTYGSIRNEKGEVLEIVEVFKKYNILHNRIVNEKYDKSTLSARRLVRLLRYHIQRFIIESKRPSYLWTKYSERNKDFINICFPGGEHLVETEAQAVYLLNTYKNLDEVIQTKFQKGWKGYLLQEVFYYLLSLLNNI